jgi:hypothetical protein
MGIASDMKRLTKDIASSHEDRLKRVGEIKGETKQVRGKAQDLIKGFQASRKELRAELKQASVAWQSLRPAKTKRKEE